MDSVEQEFEVRDANIRQVCSLTRRFLLVSFCKFDGALDVPECTPLSGPRETLREENDGLGEGDFWGAEVVQNRVGEHTCDVRQLEVQIQKSRSAMATLEDKLRVANDVIARQNADLAEAVAARKAAVREYEVAESEANELHEFLQASVKRSILGSDYLSVVSYKDKLEGGHIT